MGRVASWAAAVCGVVLVTAPGLAQEGAKAIFFGESGTKIATTTPQSTPKPAGVDSAVAAKKSLPARGDYMGIAYWVDLVSPDGGKRRVSADHVFRTGDRIKLNLRTNRPGYLYLLNIGSSGQTHILFPGPGAGAGTNAVKANLTYEVPVGASIRFDSTPGEETLLIMLSPEPMTDVAPAAPPRTAALSSDDATRMLLGAQAKGAKDLLVEADTTGPQPASYAVAPVASLKAGAMITVRVKLKHE